MILKAYRYYWYHFRKASDRKKAAFGNPRSASGRESLPDAAVGFDNSLYFEAKQPEKVRGLPEVPKPVPQENGRKYWIMYHQM